MKIKVLTSVVFSAMIAVAGCGSSSSNPGGSGGTAGTGGVGGTGGVNWVPIADCAEAIAQPGSYSIADAPETPTDGCTTTVDATGTNDAANLNAAIELASSGDTICLSPGTYDMEGSVFVTDKLNLTIKGIGTKVDDVKLDYQGRGDRGFDVAADGFTIENMWIANTAGNGVEVKAADSVFRKLFVTWDAGSVEENGAYSVYPTKCENTLVEYVEVVGASDAGLYVGQCVGGTVRYNKVYANVAGLEVENSKDVEVYGNTIFDNSGGLLALQEPNLERLANENILMHDNFVYCNNHPNFAKPLATVANIPPGTGAMSFSGKGIELRNNIMDSNESTAMLIVSNQLLCQFAGDDCSAQDGYNRYPEDIFVHDNTYINNGTDPQDIVGDIAALTGTPTPNVIWDGYKNPNTADPKICLGNPVDVTYVDLTSDQCQAETADGLVACIALNFTEDPAGRDCELTAIVLP